MSNYDNNSTYVGDILSKLKINDVISIIYPSYPYNYLTVRITYVTILASYVNYTLEVLGKNSFTALDGNMRFISFYPSGIPGSDGTSGTSGTSGMTGLKGASGTSGTSGTSPIDLEPRMQTAEGEIDALQNTVAGIETLLGAI